MARMLRPSAHVRWHRRPVSTGARGFAVAMCLVFFATWFVVVGEQARRVRVEMRDVTRELDRFSVRALQFEQEMARRP